MMCRKLSLLIVFVLAAGCAQQASTPTSAEPDANTVQAVQASQPKEHATPTANGESDAEVIYASALETASTENKRVLVHFGAPW
jgi:ABC-type molybdate transport system substrate-binding protein